MRIYISNVRIKEWLNFNVYSRGEALTGSRCIYIGFFPRHISVRVYAGFYAFNWAENIRRFYTTKNLLNTHGCIITSVKKLVAYNKSSILLTIFFCSFDLLSFVTYRYTAYITQNFQINSSYSGYHPRDPCILIGNCVFLLALEQWIETWLQARFRQKLYYVAHTNFHRNTTFDCDYTALSLLCLLQ